MPHRHAQRGVRSLTRVKPDIAKFGGFGIIRRDGNNLRALVAGFGHEVGIGRARLRHVRSPHDDKAGIVPIRAFRHVGLFAPCLRAGGGRSQYQS
jgi:hypothetical protein